MSPAGVPAATADPPHLPASARTGSAPGGRPRPDPRRGARERDPEDVGVVLPRRRLTVFTGVAGSGKSSLEYGTIAAEAQRLINETCSAFVQGFMPTPGRPDVTLQPDVRAFVERWSPSPPAPGAAAPG